MTGDEWRRLERQHRSENGLCIEFGCEGDAHVDSSGRQYLRCYRCGTVYARSQSKRRVSKRKRSDKKLASDNARYRDRRKRRVCVDCETPGMRIFSRCRPCRLQRCLAQAKRMEDPSKRERFNERHRTWRANQIEIGRCPKHACDLPCLSCSVYLAEYHREISTKPPRAIVCSKCGNPGHTKKSLRCPRRFSVDVTDYARSQRPDYQPPHRSL